MGIKLLVAELILRSILPPFYSFSMIEGILLKKLNKNPDNKSILWVLGNLYVDYKKYDKAKEHLEILCRIRKKKRPALLLLMRVYYYLNEYEKVIETLAEIEHLSPDANENLYAGESFFQLEDFTLAARHFETYVKYHRDNYIPFVRLGYAYSMQGLYDLALDAYKMADKLEPNHQRIKENIEICKNKRRLQELPISRNQTEKYIH